MSQNTIYPQGTAKITVPAAQSIAISNFGGGIAKIYYLVENANRPDVYQLQQTLEDSSVVLGAFSNQKIVKIEAGRSKVNYDVGASPDTGIGDADTVGGLLPASFVRTDDDSTVAGTITLNNSESIKFKEVGGTARDVILLYSNNIIYLGSGTNSVHLRTGGTLIYNSVILPTGTFTTTDGKTVTVTDGFITAIV